MCIYDAETWMWERISIEETEGKEETPKAECKLVWLDPHPVVMMDMCVRVSLKEKQKVDFSSKHQIDIDIIF